jgi:hypothetical protein
MGKWILGGIVGLVVLVCLGGALSVLLASDTPEQKVVTTSSPKHQVPKPIAASSVPAQKSGSIGPGTWEVGVDVKPGKYRTAGAEAGVVKYCSWQVLKGSETGEFLAGSAVTKEIQPARVTLSKGQFFITSGCKEWAPL